MPNHRLAFHFIDESPDDRAVWIQWIERADEPLRALATLGERRPSIQIAAPFEHRWGSPSTRDAEAAGLEAARQLVKELAALAASTGRSIGVLLTGHSLGVITPTSVAPTIDDKLAAWDALVAARPPDEPEWERKDYVSIWAGVMPEADVERLLDENYDGGDKPISRFARDLGISFYDHDWLEWVHYDEPRSLRDAAASVSFARSFVDLLPPNALELQVDTVIVLFESDFSARPKAVARKRLQFVAALPYAPPSPNDGD